MPISVYYTLVVRVQVYWCGPLLGGIVAGILYEMIFAANASCAKARGFLLSSSYESAEYAGPQQPHKVTKEEGKSIRMTVSETRDTELNLRHKESLLNVHVEDDIHA